MTSSEHRGAAAQVQITLTLGDPDKSLPLPEPQLPICTVCHYFLPWPTHQATVGTCWESVEWGRHRGALDPRDCAYF